MNGLEQEQGAQESLTIVIEPKGKKKKLPAKKKEFCQESQDMPVITSEPCTTIEFSLQHNGIPSYVSFDDWLQLMQDPLVPIDDKLDSFVSVESSQLGSRVVVPVRWIEGKSVDQARSVLNTCIALMEDSPRAVHGSVIQLIGGLAIVFDPTERRVEFRWTSAHASFSWQFTYSNGSAMYESLITFFMESCMLMLESPGRSESHLESKEPVAEDSTPPDQSVEELVLKQIGLFGYATADSLSDSTGLEVLVAQASLDQLVDQGKLRKDSLVIPNYSLPDVIEAYLAMPEIVNVEDLLKQYTQEQIDSILSFFLKHEMIFWDKQANIVVKLIDSAESVRILKFVQEIATKEDILHLLEKNLLVDESSFREIYVVDTK